MIRVNLISVALGKRRLNQALQIGRIFASQKPGYAQYVQDFWENVLTIV
jgi:hypothetical protein